MAATFQAPKPRAGYCLNVVTGRAMRKGTSARSADELDKTGRYARTAEFLRGRGATSGAARRSTSTEST